MEHTFCQSLNKNLLCRKEILRHRKNEKFLKQSGYCNVHDDLFEEIMKNNDTEKTETLKTVDLDFQVLKATHYKLVIGKIVEPLVVSILLLGGITNILCQS